MTDEEKRRRVERIGRERLPETLKTLTLIFDTGERYPVETFDASTMGLGLLVPLPEATVKDHRGVMLEGDERSFKLIGEVVFIIPHGEKHCRVGVQFTQTLAIDQYLSLMPEWQ